jgi:hypothetical protein
MRNVYLVTYDICDDKRLRRVFKTMRNWGDHLQYSVFECQLNGAELHKLKQELPDHPRGTGSGPVRRSGTGRRTRRTGDRSHRPTLRLDRQSLRDRLN